MIKTREPGVEGPSLPNARAIGVVYALYFFTAISGVVLAKGLIIPTDPAATASNIASHEDLYRGGIAVSLLANALYVALIALFCRLFEPVGRSLSFVAAFLGLMGCMAAILVNVFQFSLLPGSSGSTGVTAQQTTLLLSLQTQSFNVALVFFALYLLLLGYLASRATFLPRVFGLALMAAGAAWLTHLWPPLATSLSTYIQPFGFLAEFVFMLWLLVKGVDTERWRNTAKTGGEA